MKLVKPMLATALLGLLLTPNPAKALSFGVGALGGLNLGDADIDGHSDTEYRKGLAMGIRTEFGVTSPFSLLIEPTYVQKGALFQYLGADSRGELDYIEIPVLAKAKFGALKAHAYAFAGPSLGINVAAKGSIGNLSDTFEEQAANVVFSGEIGVGGAFQVQQYVYLSGDVRYSHGFSDALEDPVAGIDSWKSRDIRFMLGVLVHLSE